MEYNNFQGENPDIYTYPGSYVNGFMNPEYYGPNTDQEYGYGAENILYGNENLYDNFGNLYNSRNFQKYNNNKTYESQDFGFQGKDNKMGFTNMNNNSIFKVLIARNYHYIIIILFILTIITVVAAIINAVGNFYVINHLYK